VKVGVLSNPHYPQTGELAVLIHDALAAREIEVFCSTAEREEQEAHLPPDLDMLITENAGKSIREIFDEDGEEAFRRIESDTLYSVREMNRLVIATGGGAPARQENQEFFENLAVTFYLEVSFKEFLNRTGRDHARPLLDRSEKELAKLYKSRVPIYRSLGQCIRTDSRKPQDIAAEILKKLANS